MFSKISLTLPLTFLLKREVRTACQARQRVLEGSSPLSFFLANYYSLLKTVRKSQPLGSQHDKPPPQTQPWMSCLTQASQQPLTTTLSVLTTAQIHGPFQTPSCSGMGTVPFTAASPRPRTMTQSWGRTDLCCS